MDPRTISTKDFQRSFTDRVVFLKAKNGNRVVTYTSICRHCGKVITITETSRKAAKRNRKKAKGVHLAICPVFAASDKN